MSSAREQEILRSESKRLAAALRKTFQWYDNYSMVRRDGITGSRTPYALVSFYGITEATDKAQLANGAVITAPEPTTVFLNGILMPGSNATQVTRFKPLLQAVAKLLGAPEDGVVLLNDSTSKISVRSTSMLTTNPASVLYTWRWSDHIKQ